MSSAQTCLPPRGRFLYFKPTDGPVLLLGEAKQRTWRSYLNLCTTGRCVGPKVPQETVVFFAPKPVPPTPGPGPRPGPGPGPRPEPPGPPDPQPVPGDEYVTMQFVSDLRNAELCGFSELADPSSPPKKYRHRAVAGNLSKQTYQDQFDCALIYPPQGSVSFHGSIADSPYVYSCNFSCFAIGESETTVTYEVVFAGEQQTNVAGDPIPGPPDRVAFRIFISAIGAVPALPYIFTKPKGSTFEIAGEWNYLYWHGYYDAPSNSGSAITITVAPIPYFDVWNIQENYGDTCEFSQSIIATREYAAQTMNLADIPGFAPLVNAGQPQFCYPPRVSIVVGPMEPPYITTSAPTQTNRTTTGLGCLNNPYWGASFAGHSLSSVGVIREDLTAEDTEAAAIARATPVLGASNVARYEARVIGFSFLYESIHLGLNAAGLTSGLDYSVTVPIVTENYGGGSPVSSSLTFNFTAAGITYGAVHEIIAARGKQVTVGVATIAVASIAPILLSPTVGVNGNTWTFTFSEPVHFGVGGNGGFVATPSGGAVTLSYVSGSGTDTLIYSGSRTIQYNETAVLAYTQPGAGIRDATNLDMVSFSGLVVTNDSEVGIPPPTLVSATLLADGVTWSFVFSETVFFGGGGNGGFVPTVSGGALTLAYASGGGTDTLLYTGSRTAYAYETATLAYTQPGSGVRNASNVDLVSFSGHSVAVNSTQEPIAGMANLEQWLDVYQVTGLANNDPIGAALLDLSGNGRNVVTTMGSPLYQTNQQNGHPGILFASGKGMTGSYVKNAGDFSLVFVVRCTGAGNRVINGSNNWLVGPYGDTWQVYNGGFANTALARDANALVVIYTQSSANSVLYAKTIGTTASRASLNYPGTINFGGTGLFNESFVGYFFEFAAFSRVITSVEIAFLFSALNSKWGA